MEGFQILRPVPFLSEPFILGTQQHETQSVLHLDVPVWQIISGVRGNLPPPAWSLSGQPAPHTTQLRGLAGWCGQLVCHLCVEAGLLENRLKFPRRLTVTGLTPRVLSATPFTMITGSQKWLLMSLTHGGGPSHTHCREFCLSIYQVSRWKGGVPAEPQSHVACVPIHAYYSRI